MAASTGLVRELWTPVGYLQRRAWTLLGRAVRGMHRQLISGSTFLTVRLDPL